MTAHDLQHAAQLRLEIGAIENVVSEERHYIDTQIAHFEKQIVHGSGIKNCIAQAVQLSAFRELQRLLPERTKILRGKIQERLTQIEQLQTHIT